MTKTPNLEIFNNSWQIYQEIIRFNYMEHQDIYSELKKYITKNYPEPFSLLELGCGDAFYSAKSLTDTAISHYVGVDLSQPALNLAKQNLNGLNCSVELKQVEMWEFLECYSLSFDLILISFALHHLSSSQKQALLNKCYHHLNAGGALLLIDIFCREREPRPEYLKRYCNYVESQWQKIERSDLDLALEHITSSDCPESIATFRTWAEIIGFNQVEVIYNGTFEAHNAITFYRK